MNRHKYKPGEIIITTCGSMLQIISIYSNTYIMKTVKGTHFSYNKDYVEAKSIKAESNMYQLLYFGDMLNGLK